MINVFDTPKWGDLPGKPQFGAFEKQTAELRAELRRNPGKWAAIATGGKKLRSKVTGISRGSYGFTPAGAFEAASRSHGGAPNCTLYVRYVGEPKQAQPGKAQPVKQAPARLTAAMMVGCKCGHTQRRHTGDGSFCLVGDCDCSGFESSGGRSA